MTFFYSPEQLDFLEIEYRRMQVPELTEEFNREFGLAKSESQIKGALTNHGFLCGRPGGHSKGTYLKYTDAQADYLRRHYKRLSLAELVSAFNFRFSTNKTIGQIRAFTRNHGLKSGRTGRFRKGHTSWNTGLKGLQPGGRGRETQFKKGHKPQTWRPVGTERISQDGYRQRKVTDTGYTPGDWVGVHVLLWRQHHGEIPQGHVVIFIDGDKTHIAIENLACISRAELAYLNKHGYSDIPAELRPNAIALARLESKRYALERSP